MANLDHTDSGLTSETVELLSDLIRNECVNFGTDESGEEARNSNLLETFLEGPGVEIETFEKLPGRKSMVARIEGSNPDAPKLCLMGHTDVVPVNPDGWREDPFGGEVIDGEVWGRGAIDMLNLTSSMAVAFRHLARSGFRPEGDLIYFGVADEENGGIHGAEWMAEKHWDAIQADYVLTEFGGLPTTRPEGTIVSVATGEKGLSWRKITVRGTPGHGSMPFGADNALITAAEVIRRIAEYQPAPALGHIWEQTVRSMPFDDDRKAALLDPETVYSEIVGLGSQGAKHLHACSHTTFSPNVVRSGTKTNIIPDTVEIEIDIRSVPGDPVKTDDHLREALGDLYDQVEVSTMPQGHGTDTESTTDTPMWNLLGRLVQAAHPSATLVPSLMVGATDARFYRAKGAVAYGAGLFSAKVQASDFMNRFHGHNERVDIDSLALTTQLWLDIADQFWAEAAR